MRAGPEHLADASVRPEDLFHNARSLIEDRAKRQIAMLELIRNGDKWSYLFPSGRRSDKYNSPKTLRRQLIRCPNAVKAYGFFHNRSDGLGWVARMAVGRDPTVPTKRGKDIFLELCDRVGVPPTGRERPSLMEWIGNPAKGLKPEGGRSDERREPRLRYQIADDRTSMLGQRSE